MSIKLEDVGREVRRAFGRLLSDSAQFGLEAEREISLAAAEVVLEKAVELAPHRTGALEDSGALAVDGRRVYVAFGVSYATEAHERPENAVGPGTLAKPGNELGPAGPKYLERPMVAMQDQLGRLGAEILAEKLKEEI